MEDPAIRIEKAQKGRRTGKGIRRPQDERGGQRQRIATGQSGVEHRGHAEGKRGVSGFNSGPALPSQRGLHSFEMGRSRPTLGGSGPHGGLCRATSGEKNADTRSCGHIYLIATSHPVPIVPD